MAHKDYYEVLGVKKNDSPADIKKAYRRLARKYHPDINPGDKSAEDRFKEIQEAYNTLSDPEKKSSYDRFGDPRNRPRQGAEGPGFEGFQGFDFGSVKTGGSSFGDIFSDLFGGRRKGRGTSSEPQPQAGADLEYHISIPFLDAVNGTETRINFNRQDTCARCNGTGSSSGIRKTKTCPTCNGEGEIQQAHGTMRFVTPCPQCGGSGQVRVGDCASCGGDGRVQKIETLTVRIPAGVNTGSRVRIPRKGNAGEFGGPPGDLYLVVKVEPHKLFEREGKNIRCRIPVTVTEAALGARIEVPTVDGKAWLKVPPGTQSGQKFRLRGRGAASVKGGARGDLIVEVQVILPSVGDERSKELLREFAQLNPRNPRAELGLR